MAPLCTTVEFGCDYLSVFFLKLVFKTERIAKRVPVKINISPFFIFHSLLTLIVFSAWIDWNILFGMAPLCTTVEFGCDYLSVFFLKLVFKTERIAKRVPVKINISPFFIFHSLLTLIVFSAWIDWNILFGMAPLCTTVEFGWDYLSVFFLKLVVIKK